MEPTHAGAVCYLLTAHQIQFLIVSSSTGEHWVLPKGHIEPGEHTEAAALRELKEEAGVVGEIIKPLKMRPFDKRGEKAVVQYYLVQAVDESEAIEDRVVRWVEESEALALLSFEEASQALREGARLIHLSFS